MSPDQRRYATEEKLSAPVVIVEKENKEIGRVVEQAAPRPLNNNDNNDAPALQIRVSVCVLYLLLFLCS